MRLVDVSKTTIYVGLATTGIVAGFLVFLGQDTNTKPTTNERTALDWVRTATGTAGAFPDQGMPEDARPLYVVFDQDVSDVFHVVFEESDSLYTGRYRLRNQTAPKLDEVRGGYGWFDLSEPRHDLRAWRLHGETWEFQPGPVEPEVGPRFEVNRYNVGPSRDSDEARHLYVEGSGSNVGDASGRATCYLVYGSQTVLIEGDYLSATIEPSEAFVVAGVVRFPKPLDDNESGGVDCDPQALLATTRSMVRRGHSTFTGT